MGCLGQPKFVPFIEVSSFRGVLPLHIIIVGVIV